MKFEEVFRMLTWVVEVPRARALVKSVHIMPLKIRFRPKNIYTIISHNLKYEHFRSNERVKAPPLEREVPFLIRRRDQVSG
jgi:hypothetical protein